MERWNDPFIIEALDTLSPVARLSLTFRKTHTVLWVDFFFF